MNRLFFYSFILSLLVHLSFISLSYYNPNKKFDQEIKIDIKLSRTEIIEKKPKTSPKKWARPNQEKLLEDPEQTKILSYIRSKINEVKFKSSIAKRLNLTGVVEVNFDLEKNGVISNVRVYENRNNKILEQSAIETIRRVQLSGLVNYEFQKDYGPSIPIKVKLIYE